jgi:putative glutamine amidotransferase
MAPRIAVLMDEDTSSGGTRYEAHKGYFHAVLAAGGLPFGLPYDMNMIDAVAEFDGLLTCGGRFAYPADWSDGPASDAPTSSRLDVECALLRSFLADDRPILGICAGMQTLACLHGGRLTRDLRTALPNALPHDGPDAEHDVALAPGSRLAAATGRHRLRVNSFHREAVTRLADGLTATAHAPDGVVEAIEVADHRFALGVQWHPERRPETGLFAAFVAACRT